MKNPERLIGKKVKGFKFEHLNIAYSCLMDKFIDKVGVIKEFSSDNKACIIEFEDGQSYYYPADQIEAHLVEDEIPTLSDGVIMLVSDNGVDWQTEYVFGQRKGIYLVWNNLIDTSYSTWNHCKPLEPTKEEQLTAILGSSEKVSEIMELFKDKK
jgi:hypothetical protein